MQKSLRSHKKRVEKNKIVVKNKVVVKNNFLHKLAAKGPTVMKTSLNSRSIVSTASSSLNKTQLPHNKAQSMIKKQTITTIGLFLLLYAVTPWVCNIVVQHSDSQVITQKTSHPAVTGNINIEPVKLNEIKT